MNTVKNYYERNINKYYLGKNAENVHQKIFKMIGAGQKILDVGCSKGSLGKELKIRGNKVYGIEISERTGKQAQKVLDEVIICNIEETALPWVDEFFDVIICADVLEHLFDPENMLLKLKRCLKAEGLLIASIPNVANWSIRKDFLLGRFNYSDHGLMERGHIRFFTYDSAGLMFKKAGYKVKKIDHNITLPNIFLRLKLPPTIFKKFPKLFGFQFLFVVQK